MRMERDVLMIFIDVDHLKYINDTHGHLAGDRALIDTARVLRESCREADIIARLGGDEFVALMTVDSDQTAELVCERIKTRVVDPQPRARSRLRALAQRRRHAHQGRGNDAGRSAGPGGHRALRAETAPATANALALISVVVRAAL